MSSLNKVMLIGNVGQSPEYRKFDNGGEICSFPLATSETYKDKSGQKQSKTEWHKVVIHGKSAQVVRDYVKTGSKIFIEGMLTTRIYETKEGEKRYVTEVRGNSFKFMDSKPKESGQAQQASEPKPVHSENEYSEQDDDLPF